jgi:hypothetical protein
MFMTGTDMSVHNNSPFLDLDHVAAHMVRGPTGFIFMRKLLTTALSHTLWKV